MFKTVLRVLLSQLKVQRTLSLLQDLSVTCISTIGIPWDLNSSLRLVPYTWPWRVRVFQLLSPYGVLSCIVKFLNRSSRRFISLAALSSAVTFLLRVLYGTCSDSARQPVSFCEILHSTPSHFAWHFIFSKSAGRSSWSWYSAYTGFSHDIVLFERNNFLIWNCFCYWWWLCLETGVNLGVYCRASARKVQPCLRTMTSYNLIMLGNLLLLMIECRKAPLLY